MTGQLKHHWLFEQMMSLDVSIEACSFGATGKGHRGIQFVAKDFKHARRSGHVLSRKSPDIEAYKQNGFRVERQGLEYVRPLRTPDAYGDASTK